MFNLTPAERKVFESPSSKDLDRKKFQRAHHFTYVKGPYSKKNTMYQIVPLDSNNFTQFIDFMRSLNFNNLYNMPPITASNLIAKQMWVCINCWEVILGHDSKAEHVGGKHLLTNALADAEPANKENFVKLCRIYGKINPEETHVVLFYIP